jgi:glyoxylate/hydroxypyruvate reductase A
VVNAGRGGIWSRRRADPGADPGNCRGGAGDVREEPLPAGLPFWSHPRIIVTPHIAAETHPPTAAAIIRDAIRRFAAGLPVDNLVDPAQGY